LPEPAPPLVRDADGGLLQEQALRRVEHVDAAPERVPRQVYEVEPGVEPAEAQAKAPFALRRAVAGALVAPPAPQRRDDLRPEIDRRPRVGALDAHPRALLVPGVTDHNRGPSGPARGYDAAGADRSDRGVETLVGGDG